MSQNVLFICHCKFQEIDFQEESKFNRLRKKKYFLFLDISGAKKIYFPKKK